MLEFFPFPMLVGILLLIVCLAILWRRKNRFSYLFFFSIFWIYGLSVIGFTIFPIPIIENSSVISPIESTFFILSHINLAPFNYSQFSHLDPAFIFLREIVANILLTAPFGFGICFIARVRARNIPLLACAVGLGIEITQLLMCLFLGILYRGVDISDAIMNALGVLLGYGCYRIFSWMFNKVTERYKIDHKGLFVYIQAHTFQAQSERESKITPLLDL